jgi:drug/metabolite transporter (DMT)-like permease
MPPAMDPVVAAAVLLASLLHAGWHALVKSRGDRVIALAGMNFVSGTIALVGLPFVAIPPAPILGIIAVSVLLHVSYKLALAKLYDKADLGHGYPLARGMTPIMATLLGVLALRELPGPASLTGIALISAGIAALMFERRDKPVGRAVLGAAALVGLAVAAYTVLDAWGVRMHGDWLGFTLWLVACDSGTFVLLTLATRGRLAIDTWRTDWRSVLASGLLGSVSFGVFMWALGRAQVGPVSAMRETSVMFAALIGALFLGERASAARYVGAALVTAGVMLIALQK